MAWSERQYRMLRAMGLRPWSQPDRAQEGLTVAPAPAGPVPAVPSSPNITVVRAQEPRARSITLLEPPAPARATDDRARTVSTLDWRALREAVAQCTACALSQGRQQTVFGAGHPQARWMVVGEAPGEQEDLSGQPFVGAAGQLLDRMLAALQLTRAEDGPQSLDQRVYITNTLKCRPPRNRNPLAEESAQCAPFLARQVELLQPRIILAMGRFAVQSLLQTDEPIGRLRGRVHQYQGVPLVVTYHPAYLLRNLFDKAKAWEDLCLAAQVFEGGAGP